MLLTRRKTNVTNTKRRRLSPGVYHSVVKKVEFSDDYKDNSGLKIFYELQDADGRNYDYSELFFNVPGNQRTEAFGDYLEASGFDTDDMLNLVGFTEVLTLKWNVRGNQQFLSIVDRKVSRDTGDAECNTES